MGIQNTVEACLCILNQVVQPHKSHQNLDYYKPHTVQARTTKLSRSVSDGLIKSMNVQVLSGQSSEPQSLRCQSTVVQIAALQCTDMGVHLCPPCYHRTISTQITISFSAVENAYLIGMQLTSTLLKSILVLDLELSICINSTISNYEKENAHNKLSNIL